MPISPLDEQQLKMLHELIDGLDDRSTAWLSGYLWGLGRTNQSPSSTQQPLPASPFSEPPPRITVLSGSQTGNARQVAQQLHDDLSAAGLNATHTAISDYSPKMLTDERFLIVVTSTQGEGEPPEEAFAFFKFLSGRKAPSLEGTQFAVFGLGDSTYEHFCQAGRTLDERFEALGGSRLLPRVDADIDYDVPAQQWRGQIAELLREQVTSTIGMNGTTATTNSTTSAGATAWHRDAPFPAPVLTNQKITGRGSDRDVRHVELDLSGSGLTYAPGDALGVWYDNDAALVDEFLQTLSLSGDADVRVHDTPLTLREALLRHLELTVNSTRLIEQYAEVSGSTTLTAMVREGRPVMQAYADATPPIDMLRQHPPASVLTADALVGCLRPLAPRLYSIASSQSDTEDEVHVTVGVVRYKTDGREHTGGASGYLSRCSEDDEVRVFIERNDQFRLPNNPETPVIMIGPGTGIAPFRAFIQQRASEGGGGRNWLFFGNPHFTEDFLYQVEWQRYVSDGVLDRIDLAWSRDQAEKVYVQDRLRERGADIWTWLEDGAHVYVCGDASRMARDVDEALLKIIRQYGKLSEEDADDYLTTLRVERRYQRDIY